MWRIRAIFARCRRAQRKSKKGTEGDDEDSESDDEDADQGDSEEEDTGWSCFRQGPGASLGKKFDRPPRTPEENFRAACAQGNMSVVSKLVKSKTVDVECASESGYTGLHAAAAMGHTPVIKFLLDNNAFAEVHAGGGTSPLMLATCKGHVAAVEALLNGNASPTEEVRGARGDSRSVLQLAESFGQEKVSDLLRAALPAAPESERDEEAKKARRKAKKEKKLKKLQEQQEKQEQEDVESPPELEGVVPSRASRASRMSIARA